MVPPSVYCKSGGVLSGDTVRACGGCPELIDLVLLGVDASLCSGCVALVLANYSDKMKSLSVDGTHRFVKTSETASACNYTPETTAGTFGSFDRFTGPSCGGAATNHALVTLAAGTSVSIMKSSGKIGNVLVVLADSTGSPVLDKTVFQNAGGPFDFGQAMANALTCSNVQFGASGGTATVNLV